MTAIAISRISPWKRRLNRVRNYLSKPQNAILLALGIILTITTIWPAFSIVRDTVTIHQGTVDTRGAAEGQVYTTYNWTDLFAPATNTARKLAQINLWTPLLNSVLLSVFACIGSIFYGGLFAYLVTRTNLKFKKYLSSIFIFPYIMPQWTLAVIWRNLFNSNLITKGADGLFASVLGIRMPLWWCQGMFPSAVVLALHYAPFAYILIGGIFRNMDANLEEAATILNTPRWKTFLRVTLPLVKPAILSTILLVFSSAMGSYPIPHYLKLSTLSTKYVEMNVQRTGEASILAVIMMLFGIGILLVNQKTTSGRKNFTTVTGKSGQSSVVNLGIGKYILSAVYILTTLFTGIVPIIMFAVETFLPNPGDYSFLTSGAAGNLTSKWWLTAENVSENGMYGQKGMLFNETIWNAFGGTLLVAICCALVAGTIGTLVGYCVSKNRRSKWAGYVNNMAFLPYLMPALAVGVAFAKFGSSVGIYNTFLLLILAGTVKYIPFASRSALNSMMQLSGEIEEAAIIQDVSWWKRMTRIIIPIQKSSIISGYLLPFMTCLRELTLFMLLCSQSKIITTLLDYFDEMGLYAFSSGINLILIVVILLFNALINKLTGASIDSGIGGGSSK
ncbi:iron ABC transporter permease [Clostridiales bacterium]|jgi:iron(III) transport system permease protein|nr:iron ABC transporter permease [Clostridiales bacterium]